jgi:hypothetical protein
MLSALPVSHGRRMSSPRSTIRTSQAFTGEESWSQPIPAKVIHSERGGRKRFPAKRWHLCGLRARCDISTSVRMVSDSRLRRRAHLPSSSRTSGLYLQFLRRVTSDCASPISRGASRCEPRSASKTTKSRRTRVIWRDSAFVVNASYPRSCFAIVWSCRFDVPS